MENEKLDKILKDWDANIAPDASRREKIKQNIMQNLDRPQTTEFPRSEYFYIPKKVAYIAGIAAGICIAFLAGMQFNKANSVHLSNSNQNITNKTQFANKTQLAVQATPPEGMISLSQDEIKSLKKISSEINLLFPEGVRMITQVNDEDLQIDTEERKSLDDTKEKILIRYIVLKKNEIDNTWKKIHVSNVIASPGESLELTGEDKGYVWLHKADNDVYAIQSQLQIKANGETINLDYNGGQQLRIPQRIKTIQENNMEYRVYQEVVRI